MTEAPELQAGVSALDMDGSNPFWPKGMGQPSGPDTPATNKIDVTSITFNPADAAIVTVNVTTIPANTAWTINWGDGTAVDNVTAGTNTKQHTYANKTPGTRYVLLITSGTDTDTRTVEY